MFKSGAADNSMTLSLASLSIDSNIWISNTIISL